VTADLDTLLTALYVLIDDYVIPSGQRRPGHPKKLPDAELTCLAVDTSLGRFAAWPDAERIVGNLHRAYAELDGTPRGGPIDVATALADMVAYNGGEPLTCLA
jgi:cyclase